MFGSSGVVALCGLGVAFIGGVSVGLFLNVTHMHRMRRWANSVCDRLDLM